ncbi:MAG: archease [Actinomycetota bacterium]
MGFKIIEHTADVGIRATGSTVEEVFEQTTLGLFDILGAWHPGEEGEPSKLELESNDLGALMVDWLNEVLYVQDARDIFFTGLSIDGIEGTKIRATLSTLPRKDELDGTAVKAVTFHGLVVEGDRDGWTARVYVDV